MHNCELTYPQNLQIKDKFVESFKKRIGKNLQTAAIDAGFKTQTELAAALNVNQGTVARWFQGIPPREQQIKKLESLFGITWEELINYDKAKGYQNKAQKGLNNETIAALAKMISDQTDQINRLETQLKASNEKVQRLELIANAKAKKLYILPNMDDDIKDALIDLFSSQDNDAKILTLRVALGLPPYPSHRQSGKGKA